MNSIEIWKNVSAEPYNTSYEVSNFGNVRTKDRIIVIDRIRNGKKQIFETRKKQKYIFQEDMDGYRRVTLYFNRSYKHFFVHHLVALTFIGQPENKIGKNSGNSQVNHINGIKDDNRVDNLEWCTISENRNHAYKTGLQMGPIGEKAHFSKFKDSQIIDIRKDFKSGMTINELVKKFGTTYMNIRAIVNGKTWKHILLK